MLVQIVNFNLNGMSEQEYKQTCDTLACSICEIPGLEAKYWLSDGAANTFGGVYIWKDKTSLENFSKSELFNTIATHPNLANITSRVFEVLEGPTKVTRGFENAGQSDQAKAV